MISLMMDTPAYENDVRALLMAFFHGQKIVLNASEGFRAKMIVSFEDGRMQAAFSDGSRQMALSDTADLTQYKQTKNDLKRLVYRVLSEFTGKTLPWGTLTGIRPAKIATSLLEQGYSKEAMYRYFKEEYKISDRKFELCTEVACNEQHILKGVDYKNSYSLYVGIPFCPTICAYCSFSSYPLSAWSNKVDDYLNALFKEIDAVSEMFKHKKLLTFYMGGGTPTALSARQMDRLLSRLEEKFNINSAREVTIEAGRPDSITEEKLHVIKAHGIGRISINPQTMNQKTLDAIGRKHTVGQVYDAFQMARKCGFENINMDLIAGLPGETFEDFGRTLGAVKALSPESLTVHALAIKRAARLNRQEAAFDNAGVEEVNAMIEAAFEAAKSMGLLPYYLYRQKNIAGNLENVGYAKHGVEALYNILIMEEKQTILALGAGGSTKAVVREEDRIERIENVKSVKDYIERIDEMIFRKRVLAEMIK